jgi:hypothetical protein
LAGEKFSGCLALVAVLLAVHPSLLKIFFSLSLLSPSLVLLLIPYHFDSPLVVFLVRLVYSTSSQWLPLFLLSSLRSSAVSVFTLDSPLLVLSAAPSLTVL